MTGNNDHVGDVRPGNHGEHGKSVPCKRAQKEPRQRYGGNQKIAGKGAVQNEIGRNGDGGNSQKKNIVPEFVGHPEKEKRGRPDRQIEECIEPEGYEPTSQGIRPELLLLVGHFKVSRGMSCTEIQGRCVGGKPYGDNLPFHPC